MHLSDTELSAFIRSELEERKEEVAAERQRRGIKAIDWRKVISVHYLAIPSLEEIKIDH